MTEYATELLDRLPMPIAVATESGDLVYRNATFNEAFGSNGEQWIRQAARTVGGERGWLQGFFTSDEHRSTDVEFNGRVYRADKIMRRSGEPPTAAISFEDVTRQREMEQAKSDFTSMV